MAQTIALQRGTATVTWDGSSTTTLFTQSGGTATRVIIGGISAFTASNPSALGMQLSVGLAGSTTNTVTIAYKASSNQQSYGAIDFIPGLMPTSGAKRPDTSDTITGSSVLGYSTAGSFGSAQNTVNALLTGASSGCNFGQSTFNYEYCPLQFWIGPSDIVRWRGYNNSGGYTGTVAYSFITITES